MMIVWTLILFSAIILNSIELGLQSNSSPGDEAEPSSSRQRSVVPTSENRSPRRSLRLASRRSSAAPLSPAKRQSPVVSPPSPEPDLHARSRSPQDRRQNFRKVLGFNIEDLRTIRLKPFNNPNRIFELQHYTFPLDKPIRLRNRDHVLYPLPTQAQIVLSASNGDVFAVVRRTWSNNTILRAIYKPDDSTGGSNRAKINMHSEEVEVLTNIETLECPVSMHAIRSLFDVYRVSRTSLNQ